MAAEHQQANPFQHGTFYPTATEENESRNRSGPEPTGPAGRMSRKELFTTLAYLQHLNGVLGRNMHESRTSANQNASF